jgi:hypothetical protein
MVPCHANHELFHPNNKVSYTAGSVHDDDLGSVIIINRGYGARYQTVIFALEDVIGILVVARGGGQHACASITCIVGQQHASRIAVSVACIVGAPALIVITMASATTLKILHSTHQHHPPSLCVARRADDRSGHSHR